MQSSLFAKILLWIPIFAVFIAAQYMDSRVRLLLLIFLIVISLFEMWWSLKKHGHAAAVTDFALLYSFGLLHFCLLSRLANVNFTDLLITLCFATIFSDVTAFFFGNYFGRHKLPDRFNSRKSWEGVVGQLVGAFIGVGLVNIFITPVTTFWLFVPFGLGSALGDLANSYTKRTVGIKDWSRALPGHGGVTDRLSSLAGSALFAYYFLSIYK